MQPSEHISRFFCSWSGGKDSCLSLYRAIKGIEVIGIAAAKRSGARVIMSNVPSPPSE